ncbi:MAG: single-stranded DNA-binding protein [Bacteroidetes bacterium]|nr:single-stranded DNA-binding protein [Bacteroidota bacterium]
MRGLNKVMLIGHLGKDPEIQHLEQGVTLAKFSIATSEAYTDKDGQKVTQTEWHNIVIWRKLAEIAEQFLKKGSLIYLEGKIRTRSWEDKEGNKRYSTEIVADNFTMLDKKGDADSIAVADQSPAMAEEPEGEQETVDDLPF